VDETFKVGEVALINQSVHKGRECTILEPLRFYVSGQSATANWDSGYYYKIRIHGLDVPYPFIAAPKALDKKPKLPPREEIGEWELCPWRPVQVPTETLWFILKRKLQKSLTND
jgi:hypothetical protein